jgi:ribonuclease D
MPDAQLLTTTDTLITWLDQHQNATILALDTEFHRTTSYFPELCLFQIAAGEQAEQIAVVDVLAEGIELQPLWAFLQQSPALKVWHAPRQDIEIIVRLAGFVPTPMVDTQVAIALCGGRSGMGYDILINDLLGIKLDKSPQFSDWRRRPLSPRQWRYAADDVRYLWRAWVILAEKLHNNKRRAWLDDEMNALSHRQIYLPEPNAAWQRLNIGKLKPRAQHRAARLACWREKEAIIRNIPRGHIFSDDYLIDWATRPPRNEDSLKPFLKDADASSVLALCNDDVSITALFTPPAPLTRNQQRLADFLKLALALHADAEGIDATLLMTNRDIDSLVRHDLNIDIVQTSWRRHLLDKIINKNKNIIQLEGTTVTLKD